MQVVPMWRVIPTNLNAAVAHARYQIAIEVAASPLQQDMRLHLIICPVNERVSEFVTDRSAPEDIGLQCNAVLRARDALEHRLKYLVAIDQFADLFPSCCGRPRIPPSCAQIACLLRCRDARSYYRTACLRGKCSEQAKLRQSRDEQRNPARWLVQNMDSFRTQTGSIWYW